MRPAASFIILYKYVNAHLTLCVHLGPVPLLPPLVTLYLIPVSGTEIYGDVPSLRYGGVTLPLAVFFFFVWR